VLTTYGTADRADAFAAQVTAYNPVISANVSSSSANNQVVNVLREVVAELQALRTTGADTKAAVEKTTALLDQVTGGGNAMLTETA
jgi:predicted RNA-binding Zn ribbon-like protein